MTPPLTHTAPYQAQTALLARVKRKLVQAYCTAPQRLSFSQGVVSFSFDDAPQNAITNGAAALEAHGARATFYLCDGFTGGQTHFGVMHTLADINRLLEAGHEIGCHSYSHQDGARAPAAQTLRDIDANAKAFAAHSAPPFTAYAYPYGEAHFTLKHALAQRFATARGIVSGLNIGLVDRSQLRAQALYGEATWPAVSALLHAANQQRGWAILFTHDVSEAPTPWGCTPEMLNRALDLCTALSLPIAPVSAAFRTGRG
jgi:peptidoglycan/xylan/chitin deacetylase (PgdA/CDA1 family)